MTDFEYMKEALATELVMMLIEKEALYIILCKSRIRDSEMSLVFSLLLIL